MPDRATKRQNKTTDRMLQRHDKTWQVASHAFSRLLRFVIDCSHSVPLPSDFCAALVIRHSSFVEKSDSYVKAALIYQSEIPILKNRLLILCDNKAAFNVSFSVDSFDCIDDWRLKRLVTISRTARSSLFVEYILWIGKRTRAKRRREWPKIERNLRLHHRAKVCIVFAVSSYGNFSGIARLFSGISIANVKRKIQKDIIHLNLQTRKRIDYER